MNQKPKYTARQVADAISKACPELDKEGVFHNIRYLHSANQQEICELAEKGRLAEARQHVTGVSHEVHIVQSRPHSPSVSFHKFYQPVKLGFTQ